MHGLGPPGPPRTHYTWDICEPVLTAVREDDR